MGFTKLFLRSDRGGSNSYRADGEFDMFAYVPQVVTPSLLSGKPCFQKSGAFFTTDPALTCASLYSPSERGHREFYDKYRICWERRQGAR
jgi:hypothetical protein